MERHATVAWNGSGRDGIGLITTQSAALKGIPFSFNSRFVSANGTNPEELLAAAYASCFIMKLNFVLEAAGFITKRIEATAYTNFERGLIAGLRMLIKASVPHISYKAFYLCVQDAKMNCPVSQIINIEVTAEVFLENS